MLVGIFLVENLPVTKKSIQFINLSSQKERTMKVKGAWKGPKVILNNISFLSEKVDPNIIGKGPVALDLGEVEYELEISVEEMIQQIKNVKELWTFIKEEVIPDLEELFSRNTVNITPDPSATEGSE